MAIIHKLASGELTGNTLVYTGPCFYYGHTCKTGGSNRTITIYDNTSAAGRVIESFTADGNKTMDGHSHAIPVKCLNGIYAAIGGGTVEVYFTPSP